MKQIIRALAFIAGIIPVIAAAQTFPTLPANTIIGRLGIGSGPSQAVPITAFAAAGGFAKGLQTCSSNTWFYTLSATGTFGCSQPSFSSISGNIAVSQMNSGTGASSSTVWTGNASWTAPQTFAFTPTNASPAALTIQSKLQRAPVMCEDYSGGCTTANIITAIQDSIINTRCYQLNGNYTLTTTVLIDAANLSGNTNPCFTGRGSFVGPASGVFSAVLEFKNVTGITVSGNIAINCNSNAYTTAGLKIWGTSANGAFQTPAFSKIVNCRQGINVGDPTQSTVAISEINITGTSFFNVAQGVRIWSSNAVVNLTGMTNNVDAHSSGSWALTGTGTCTTSTITISSPGANSYFDQYDKITGTNIVAGTYITGQASGTAGGAGVYNLSTTGNTCSGVAVTGEKRAINIWTSGGTANITGGEVVNTITNDGILCVVDVMASPNSYGNCMFTGVVLEAGGLFAASFNPAAIGSPTGGGLSFVGSRGFIGGTTTTDAIVTDSTFPGNITVSGNRFFGTAARTGRNIVANTTSTKVYFDIGSFGDNMLQGYAGVSGGTAQLAATTGGAKAWVVFTGASGAIQSSYNVTSVTRNSAGDYTVNFTNAIGSTNYAVTLGLEGGTTAVIPLVKSGGRASATLGITSLTTALAAADPTSMSISVFGLQ